jgi:hippurate hydrolase
MNAPTDALLDAAQSVMSDVVALRRDIHANPELGLQLPRTQARIVEALTGLGLDIKTGEGLSSVVADLDTGRPGPTVLLRGDMDALPLTEESGEPFSSTIEGRMHACGHDTHVAMLVGAAHVLTAKKDELNGRVRFMFQPGEEGFHGARYMIEEGVLKLSIPYRRPAPWSPVSRRWSPGRSKPSIRP